MKLKQCIIILWGLIGLAGCAAPGIEAYQKEKPTLVLEEYLNGTLDAYGIFQSRRGLVEKRFHAVIEARWTGNQGVLDESFSWSDGTTSRRVWHLERQSDGTYHGRADDVVGTAIGEIAGNALRWQYVLALPVEGTTYHVDFDDWMFLMDERIMLNRSSMSKWGIHLGEVVLTFVKRDPATKKP